MDKDSFVSNWISLSLPSQLIRIFCLLIAETVAIYTLTLINSTIRSGNHKCFDFVKKMTNKYVPINTMFQVDFDPRL